MDDPYTQRSLVGWQSIDRRLPLLIGALLFITLATFSWTAYVRVERILLVAAGARLESASTVVSLMLANAQAQERSRLAAGATDSAVTRYLRTHRDAGAARRALAAAWLGEPGPGVRVELRDASGAIVLDTARGRVPPSSGWIGRTIGAGGLAPGAAVLGPLFAAGDVVYAESIVPIVQGGHVVAYVSGAAFLQATNAQAVRDLVGKQAKLLVGSPTEGAWTDFDHPSGPPPGRVTPGAVTIFRGGVGATMPIHGTPWLLWVEQPRAVVLVPMQRLVTEIGILAIFFVIGGTSLGWIASRRITGPLLSLTGKAERMARSEENGPSPVVASGRDEVGRLTDAFGRMVARVEESRIELEQQVQAAEQANRVKSDFLAVMSHELRTPLNAIIGYAELIRHELCGPVTVDQQEKLRRMRRSADELLRLINQVLDLERIGAGQERVAMESMEVGDLLRSAVAHIEPQALERGLTLTVVPPDPPLIIVSDVTKLKAILLNLMSNAVKYTERGEVRVSAERGDGVLELTVQDTGIGIPPEDRHHIFEPFWQADQRLTRRVGGTGLGLTIVHRLTQMLGGDISVDSTPGKGSTFTVRVPLSQSRAAVA